MHARTFHEATQHTCAKGSRNAGGPLRYEVGHAIELLGNRSRVDLVCIVVMALGDFVAFHRFGSRFC